MSYPPRSRGFGCLGIFSILCLSFFTTIELAALFRLNPDWFDRMAFWRGPILEPEYTLVNDPKSREEQAKSDAELIRQMESAADPGKVMLLDLATVVGQYEPQSGLTLSNPTGAEFRIPAGALPNSVQVSMTPATALPAAMSAELAGPVYQIRVGAAEHTNFRQPANITLPMFAEKSKSATIAIWDGNRWQALDSKIDSTGKLITAQVPHLSLLGVLTQPLTGRLIAGLGGTGAALITFIATSPTIRAGTRSAVWWAEGLPKIETQNFVVHYYPNETWLRTHPRPNLGNPRGGPAPPPTIATPPPPTEHAVIEDAKYALTRGRKSGEHPLFVQDVAEWLEQSRSKLEALGVPLRKPAAIRYDVFLIAMKDYGDTNMGGPVFISTKLPEFAERDKYSLEAAMRSTIAHELVHVAQDSWFRMDQGWRWRWWMESSAAYLGDRCWEPDFAPDTVRRAYLMTNVGLANRLPASPMDAAKDSDYYAYATFYGWLDRTRSGAGLKFVQLANAQADATIAGLDKFARDAAGAGLGDLWTEFAMDFYHNDLWRGETTPSVHRGISLHSQLLGQSYRSGAGGKDIPDVSFSYVTRGGTRTDWALTHVRRTPHLSAQALYVRADQLAPAIRKGKLVVAVEPQNDGTPPEVLIADTTLGGGLPAKGNPGTFAAVGGPNRSILLDNWGTGGGKNAATILLVNRSLTEMAGSVYLRRWLLLAPAFAEFQREEPVGGLHSRHWTVTWHRAELKDFPEAFKGYNVYRRKWGEPDSAFVRVKTEAPDEVYTDHAPDDEDYAYMVRVVDALGNESADSPVEKYDPFQGIWEGEVKLVDGSLVEPLIAAFKKAGEEEEKKELAAIAKIEDPAERARRQREWDATKQKVKSLFEDVVKLLRTFEQFARLGIPIQMKIRRTKGEYFMSFPEVCWQATGWKDEDDIAMTRDGMQTLKVKKMPEGLPDMFLRLHRKDEIRGEYTLDKTEGNQRLFCKIKWSFERKAK